MTSLAHPLRLRRPSTASETKAGSGAAKTVFRRVLALVEGLALGIVVALILGSVVPGLFGHKILSVLSGSMEPTIGTGDAVLVQTIAPRDIKIGDIVTFRDPTDQSRLMTHRVRGLQRKDGSVHVVTKGDANTGVEKWSVPLDGEVGRVRSKLPHLGYAFVWTRGTLGRLLLLVLPAMLLTFFLLRRIWRSEPGRQAVAYVKEVAAPAVKATQTALGGHARTVTVAAPEALPGDRLSAVVLLGEPEVVVVGPYGWKLVDDRRMKTGRLLRFDRVVEEDEPADYTFRASFDTTMSVNVMAYAKDAA